MSETQHPFRMTAPTPGGPFAIAWQDIRQAVLLAPMWLHAGWIDVIWRFRRTRIGPFWHTLSLGAFVVVMGTIWSVVLAQDPALYFRYVGTGLIVWSLIASFITEGASAIINGQSAALSMRFPYVAFALGHGWRALLLFAHHFVLYLLIVLGTWYWPGWAALLAIPGLALVVANGVWMSLLAGIIGLRRRDFVPAIATAMQLMMFVTPVFWPKDKLGPELAFAADLNPLYHLIGIVRDPLLGVAPPLESWLFAVVTLGAGWLFTLWVYGRCRDRMAYWY